MTALKNTLLTIKPTLVEVSFGVLFAPEGSQKRKTKTTLQNTETVPSLLFLFCGYQSSQLFSTVSRTRLVYSFRLSL